MHSHKISYIFQLKYRQWIYIPLLNNISTALCGTYKSSGRQVGCDTDRW